MEEKIKVIMLVSSVVFSVLSVFFSYIEFEAHTFYNFHSFYSAGNNDKGYKHVNLPQKRKSDVAFDSQDTEAGKNLRKQDMKEDPKPKDDGGFPSSHGKPVKKTFGISMNIGGTKKAGPIKMTMPSQVCLNHLMKRVL